MNLTVITHARLVSCGRRGVNLRMNSGTQFCLLTVCEPLVILFVRGPHFSTVDHKIIYDLMLSTGFGSRYLRLKRLIIFRESASFRSEGLVCRTRYPPTRCSLEKCLFSLKNMIFRFACSRNLVSFFVVKGEIFSNLIMMIIRIM